MDHRVVAVADVQINLGIWRRIRPEGFRPSTHVAITGGVSF